MSDKSESTDKPIEIRKSADTVKSDATIGDTQRQSEWQNATEGYRTTDRESATMETLSEQRVAEIQANGGWNKFEIIDESANNGAGSIHEHQPKRLDDRAFELGLSYDERDTRSLYTKLSDFATAAMTRATDSAGQEAFIQGELDKMLGVAEGLNIAKEHTKDAVSVGFNALTDGTVARFLSKPNAINDPLFHAVGGALDAMTRNPNAVNDALKNVGEIVLNASDRYGTSSNRDKGRAIGEAMFFMVNPEGSTEAGEVVLGVADRVATQVDAAVMKSINQSMEAMRGASPDVANEIRQTLYDYLLEHGLTRPELEAAGIPKGFFNEMEKQSKGADNFFSTSEGGSAFRGDHDVYSPVNEKGRPKSYINEGGDLTPANPEGLYKGRKVTLAEHLNGGWCKAQKANSPYTSFGFDQNHVIAKFGENYVELDLARLESEIARGTSPDVVIRDLDAILKSVAEHPTFPAHTKKFLTNCAMRDREILVEGVIPKRFLKVFQK